MKARILLIVFMFVSSCGQKTSAQNSNETEASATPHFFGDFVPAMRSFLQLSYEDTGEEDGIDSDSRIALIIILNVVGCVVLCLLVQGALYLSKKMRLELNWLRRNYEEYESLMRFRQYRKNMGYNPEETT